MEVNMNRKQKGLFFPIISLLLIAVIYSSLSIANLDKKAQASESNKSKYDQRISEFEILLEQYDKKLNKVAEENDNLSKQLATVANSKPQTVKVTTPGQVQTVTQTETVYQTEIKQIEKNQATVTIENVGAFKVNLQSNDNVLTVLKRASEQNNFGLKYDTYSFGVFITGIGGINPTGNKYWAFYFNGAFSNVGASDQPVVKGDSIFWQLASF
jgi:hypothetical protein